MKLSQIFFMIEIRDEIFTETFWLVFLQPSLTMIYREMNSSQKDFNNGLFNLILINLIQGLTQVSGWAVTLTIHRTGT